MSTNTLHPTAARLRAARLSATLLACCAALGSLHSPLRAQAAPAGTAADEVDNSDPIHLSQFLVSTGFLPQRRIESPLSTTTIDPGQIAQAKPRSVADLIQMVPGFYVEPSGGEVRNNVYVRGLSTGGYQYIALQEDGLPVLSVSNSAFSNADLWTRMSNWVSRVEAMRSGNAGILVSNAPAGLINYIGREGSPVHQGEFMVQTGDIGGVRVEGWESGPINDRTTYAIGGWYKHDRGVRDAGFNANAGFDLKGNIKYSFPNDRGYVKILARYMLDRTTFYYPFPLANIQDPHTIPGGIDIRYGSAMSNDLRFFDFKGTPDGDLHYDLKNGNYTPLYYAGTEVEIVLADGLKLQNRNRYTYSPHTSDQIQYSSTATPLQTLANNLAKGAAAGTQFAAAKDASGNYRFRLTVPGEGAVIDNPAGLNGNGLGDLSAQRHTFNYFHNFQNDLRLLKNFPEAGANVTAGFYYAWLKADIYKNLENWLTEVRDLPRRLDIQYLDATSGAPIGYGTYQGIYQLNADYRRAIADQTSLAGYLDAEKAWGNWNFDAGVRYEVMHAKERAQTAKSYNLNPAGSDIPALKNAKAGSGVWNDVDFGHISGTGVTAGANYKFDQRLGAYVRYSKGYYFPITDQFEVAAAANDPYAGPTTRIQQLETGLKYSSRRVSIFATVFGGWVKGQPFTGVYVTPSGTIANLNESRDIFSRGVELEAFYTPIDDLTFHFTGTFQKAEFTSDEFVSGTDSNGTTIVIPIHGHEVVRVPKIYTTLSASYRLPAFSFGRAAIDVAWIHNGRRFADEANRGVLKAYEVFNAGVSFQTNHRITFRAHVQNVLNGTGITEGDPRLNQLVADPNARYFNGRPILPRSLVVSAEYRF